MGVPLTPYGKEKKEFKNYLRANDKVSFYYEGIRYVVHFGKVRVFAQCHTYQQGLITVIDRMQEFVRDFTKQSRADNEQIMQDAVTRILATIISAMGQQAGGCVAVPAMMQMQGMNVMPVPPVTPAESTEAVKKMVAELPENNLELSDKPLDDGALAFCLPCLGMMIKAVRIWEK